MRDVIELVTARSVRDKDNWIRITWEVTLDGKVTHIDSGYGPRNRQSFLDSIGIQESKISSLVGKTYYGRVFRDGNQNLKVAHDSFFVANPATKNVSPPPPIKNVASSSLTQRPFTGLVAKVPVPTPQPVVIPAPVLTKNTAGVKGADTKLLKKLNDLLSSLLDREGMDNRVHNPALFDQVEELQVTVLKQLASR